MWVELRDGSYRRLDQFDALNVVQLTSSGDRWHIRQHDNNAWILATSYPTEGEAQAALDQVVRQFGGVTPQPTPSDA